MSKLSSELEQWLQGYNALVKTLKENGFKATSTNAREGLATLTRTLVTEIPKVAWIQDDLVEGESFDVPVRIYNPKPEIRLPVLLYFHGGGGMAGSVTVYDPICRKLALATNHLVVSADYRLAPECPYPAGITDAKSIVKNIWATLDQRQLNYARQLAIAGDSGGGAICGTISHWAQKKSDIDINKQVLIYPSLDYTLQHESVSLNGEGYLLYKDKIKWYFDNYFRNDEDRKALSPLHMTFIDSLPETLMITAEFCPLRDEGIAYIAKLNQTGVPNQHLHFDDMIHAFINMENLAKKQCLTLYEHIGKFLSSS